MAFGASFEHPNISHRPHRSILEELSAPLELSQPLPDLMDGRTPHASPSPRRHALGEGIQVQPQGHLSSGSTCPGVTADSEPESPSTHTLLSLLDYGIQPKHPRPRGPRPLLSRARQRKRDGPDMAEYYFNTRR